MGNIQFPSESINEMYGVIGFELSIYLISIFVDDSAVISRDTQDTHLMMRCREKFGCSWRPAPYDTLRPEDLPKPLLDHSPAMDKMMETWAQHKCDVIKVCNGGIRRVVGENTAPGGEHLIHWTCLMPPLAKLIFLNIFFNRTPPPPLKTESFLTALALCMTVYVVVNVMVV